MFLEREHVGELIRRDFLRAAARRAEASPAPEQAIV
jgi:hypothetical protein